MEEKTYSEQLCGYCKGTGKVEGEECPACHGNNNFYGKRTTKKLPVL